MWCFITEDLKVFQNEKKTEYILRSDIGSSLTDIFPKHLLSDTSGTLIFSHKIHLPLNSIPTQLLFPTTSFPHNFFSTQLLLPTQLHYYTITYLHNSFPLSHPNTFTHKSFTTRLLSKTTLPALVIRPQNAKLFLLPGAGLGKVAVRVDDTLWPAAGVGIAKVLWPTGAGTAVPAHRRVSVGATRRRIAGVTRRLGG